MKKVIIVSDYTVDEVPGGSEQYVQVLFERLTKKYECKLIKSADVHKLIEENKDAFWIINNFKLLGLNQSAHSAECLTMDRLKECRYVIVEHDHQYCKANNPTLFEDMNLPESQIQNREFYKNAQMVFCQSLMHAQTLQKNLMIPNVFNLSCNLWSDDHLNLLRENLGTKKTRKFGIMESQNKNKGMKQTIEYCQQNNIQYELIPFCSVSDFYKELSKTETLVFFPQWMESFCRVATEARILGCRIISNKVLGCSSEMYFRNFKEEKLLSAVQKKQADVLMAFSDAIENKLKSNMPLLKQPKVSIITTVYNGEKYIDGFLSSIKNQTYQNFELIIVDAASDDKTSSILVDGENSGYRYIRTPEKITPMAAFNLATKESSGEYIVCTLIDDRLAPNYLETMIKHLNNNSDIDLVYADCLQTTKPNETFLQNSSRGRLYEHSRMEFSRENMIKCLPGPMPMYRKSIHEKFGLWSENLKHAGDHELWLRCVRGGSKFKKVDRPLGLYYYNPNGLSTNSNDQELVKRRRVEERDVFNEYRDVIGEANHNLYKEYFNMDL